MLFPCWCTSWAAIITGEAAFGLGTVVAIAVLAVLIYFLVRPNKYNADYQKDSAPS